MAIDWNLERSALQHSQKGNNLKAIAIYSALMSDAETDSDRAVIVLGEASCYSRLGKIEKSRELLDLAKNYARGDPAILSQVEMSDASLDAQEKKYKVACEKFAALKSKYHDLLVQPEYDDFALELDSRLACALVDARKYDEAVPIFRRLFERSELEDKQRLQIFFSAALMRSGRMEDAQPILFEAAEGTNAELSQTALEYLSEVEMAQKSRQTR